MQALSVFFIIGGIVLGAFGFGGDDLFYCNSKVISGAIFIFLGVIMLVLSSLADSINESLHDIKKTIQEKECIKD